MKFTQKGFTLIEGLLIVIALSLVVGVGFYVVNANKSSTTREAISQTESNTGNDVNEKYLEIKELGVKIPLGEELEDLSYFVVEEGRIGIKSKKQEERFQKAGCLDEGASSGGDLASVAKRSGTFQKQNDFEELFKQFNSFSLSGWSTITDCQNPQAQEAEMLEDIYTENAKTIYDKLIDTLKNAKQI